ncbi:MAG: hypothetical protein WCI18_01215 [Pseudomonadota bacterium]
MKNNERLAMLLLLGLTNFGTNLTSFVGFKTVGVIGGGLEAVAIALSLKTLCVSALVLAGSGLSLHLGGRTSVLGSQIIGVLCNVLLGLALWFKQPGLSVAVIVASAIPSVVLNNVITVIFRRVESDEHKFKSSQALRGTIAAISFLLAGLSWPIIEHFGGWQGVLCFDLATYLVAAILLPQTKFFKNGDWGSQATKSDGGSKSAEKFGLFTDSSMLIYLLFVVLSYACVAIIPLIASSNSFFVPLTVLPDSFRGAFWAIEATSIFLANLAYRNIWGIKSIRAVASFFLIPNGFLLYLIGDSDQIVTIILMILLARIGMELGVLSRRDDLILKAASLGEQVRAVSMTSVASGIAMALSPFVVIGAYSLNALPLLFITAGVLQMFVLFPALVRRRGIL